MDATRLKKANPYTGNNSVKKKREREKKKTVTQAPETQEQQPKNIGRGASVPKPF
jgi:hypothetical protein